MQNKTTDTAVSTKAAGATKPTSVGSTALTTTLSPPGKLTEQDEPSRQDFEQLEANQSERSSGDLAASKIRKKAQAGTRAIDGPRPNWVRNTALARHFNVSAMCIWRWKRDPELGCPPTYIVRGKEWNDLNAWDDWMKKRVIRYIDVTRPRAEKGQAAKS